MLNRYANNENIYQISGAQFTPMISMNEDYTFSFYGHTGCGWATFRRAWCKFNLSISDFDNFLNHNNLHNQFATKRQRDSFIKGVIKMKQLGPGHSSWDRCWSYIKVKNNGLSIVPKVNLTRNIGFYGLHGDGEKDFQKLSYDENFEALNHPELVDCNKKYDLYHFNNYIYHSLYSKIVYKIKKIFHI